MDKATIIAADAGKSVERTAFLSLLIGMALQLIGFVIWTENEPAGLAVQGVSIACMLIGSAVAIFGRDNGRADWLRLDRQGITLVQRGRIRTWPWSDMSMIGRRGLFSVTAPRYGRSLALRVAHDGEGSGPGRPETVIIGDDYLTPIGEISELLESFLQSPGGGSSSASDTQVERPDIFLKHDASGNSGSRRKTIVAWLFVSAAVVACMIYGSAGPLLVWPEPGTPFTDYLGVRTAAFFAALFGFQWTVKDAIRGEFLLLSSDGLHLRLKGDRRHWRWRDLSDFDLSSGSSTAGDDSHPEAALAFMTKGEELTLSAGSKDISIAYALQDTYDTPLAEIARRIEIWRHPARGGGAETVETGGPESAPGAVEIRGASQGEMGMIALIGLAGVVGMLLAGFALLALVPIGIGLLGDIPEWLKITLMLVGFPSVILFFLVGIGRFLPSEYVLRFEEDSFALKRLGVWRRWKWHELSACEIRTARLPGESESTVLAIFNVPRSDWVSRLWLWYYRLDTGRPSVPIEPVYEAPLGLIVKRFENYRGRALSRRLA